VRAIQIRWGQIFSFEKMAQVRSSSFHDLRFANFSNSNLALVMNFECIHTWSGCDLNTALLKTAEIAIQNAHQIFAQENADFQIPRVDVFQVYLRSKLTHRDSPVSR
jgi:hypothetical protein